MQFNKSDLPKIKECADYIRYLSLMSVEYANSGHPGLPLGCAEIGTILYNYFLKINPEMPGWINRDRFILSAGHGSMFLYSLLYLAGYKFTLQDLADFRQMGSITPGHPEYNIDMGIETTTGPLGQGFANAVGLAIKGKMLAARFNKPGFDIFNYRVFTLMGDGCNMEGLSSEAASIAGHLGLDNLIAIYDSNNITIDGSTDITFTENVALRYEAQGWQTAVCDISDIEDFYQKLAALSAVSGKPKLLVVKTIIGQGLDKSRGSHEIHGAPAGVSEIAYFIQNSCMKKIYGKEYPDEINDREKLSAILGKLVKEKAPLKDNTSVTDFFQQAMKKNSQSYHAWTELFSAYSSKFPKEHDQLLNSMSFSIPERLAKDLINFKVDKADATRNIAGKILELCCAQIPQIIGGSADLVGSTRATVKGSVYINKNDFSGRNIAFGVRENAMGSIGNGLSLGGMLIPFTSTFFTFFDYMKPAVRLAALMKLKHLFIFTHDSIYVGEDGPTHQPVEHLNSLRLIPDLLTFRPGNAMETAFSFLYFFENMEGPAVILGSRQKLDQAVFNLT
ncbi:MAG TPA: transketolase, partial [Spirochaetia bacterium]|nr:transketolase [Spirochaetia bacterium]